MFLHTDMSNDAEKAKLGASTLKTFCESWGNDVHSKILLEVLFEGLMNEETLFVFGQPKQAGDQVNYSTSGGIDCHIEGDKSQQSESPPDLGTEDLSDYP